MTKTTTKTSQKKPEAPALSAALAAGQPAANLWLEIMSESTRFVSERLKTDIEMQRAMMRCQSPGEMAQLQAEFFRKAVEQYTAEAQRMLKLMSDATDKTIKQSGAGTKRGYDDVPL